MNKFMHHLPKFIKINLTIIPAFIVLFGLILFFNGQSPTPVKADAIRIGLVPDIGGIHDQSFNQLAYQGMLQAESDLGVTGTVYTTTGQADYAPKLQQCVLDGNQLCISVGFLLADDTINAANTYSQTKFAIIDYDLSSIDYPSNLRGITFAEKEVGYLAGTLAGKMTQSNVIGAVGGMDIPPVVRFEEGYRNGAQCANPAVSAIITYTNSFVDPALGAQVAQDMLNRNADVIFGVGGETGNGAILTATQSGAWGIGVDSDQYYNLFGGGTVPGSDKLLTSAQKRVDVGVFNTISAVVSDTFTSGNVLEDLATGGVGLAPYHQADASVSQAVRDELESVRLGIVNGTIDVNNPCRNKIYFPILSK